MEVKGFMNKNKNLSYEDLKDILEKKYKLKVNLDKNNNYYMISCTNESNFSLPFVRQCSGVILEKDTNKILHYFGERAYNVNDNLINFKNINIEIFYITQHVYGKTIKIFYYKNKWKFATSKHTDIKYFKIENLSLYDFFKKCIIETFNTMYDFLYSLDKDYCYSFLLYENKLKLISKTFLKTLKVEINFNNFIKLTELNVKNIKVIQTQNFILLEKDNIKRIHISKNDIINLLHINKYCYFNNECFNKICPFKHNLNRDILENYRRYIILKRSKNPLFKTQYCKNGNYCKEHEENKCKYKHDNDPVIEN